MVSEQGLSRDVDREVPLLDDSSRGWRHCLGACYASAAQERVEGHLRNPYL